MPKLKLAPMPRLPKEPSPHMIRSFGRPSLERLPAPDPSAAPIASPSPCAYRDANPDNPPPSDYKPPSMLAEHKRLAIVLALLCTAFGVYCWKVPHAPSASSTRPATPAPAASRAEAPTPAPTQAPAQVPAKQPIYVETIPDT